MTKTTLSILLALSVSANIFFLFQSRDTGPDDGLPEEPSVDVVEAPAPGTYPFIRVIDGNTVAIGYAGRTEHVRLLGIRAPEPNVPGGPECQANEAIAHLRTLARTGTVVMAFDGIHGPRDTLGRLTAYIELPDGTDLGESMLQDGFAREFSPTVTHDRSEQYQAAEQYANENELGLWNPEICS